MTELKTEYLVEMIVTNNTTVSPEHAGKVRFLLFIKISGEIEEITQTECCCSIHYSRDMARK